MRVSVCATQVPFQHGGAEALSSSLLEQLSKRRFEAELVTVPFAWIPRMQILKSALAWRLLSLSTANGQDPDLVISTRFPSYLIQHRNKVVWLIHQFRQVYDLLGTEYSDFGTDPLDDGLIDKVRRMDHRAFSETRSIFAISRNVARRLESHNGFQARVLYPPPKLGELLQPGDFGDYILSAGRLDAMKRTSIFLESMSLTKTAVRCKIVGMGSERKDLESTIRRLGLQSRVELLGEVSEEQLVELYSNCLAVFYAPYDEDYGYVTIEAFKSGKPVLTASDSGAVLEFVDDGSSGFVHAADDFGGFSDSIDLLFTNRERAAELGRSGRERVESIHWNAVIEALTGARHCDS